MTRGLSAGYCELLMTRSRQFLEVIAAVWLSCQLGTVALVPIALWMNPDGHAAACTCTHGADATCPMHHKSAPAGSKVCAMQSASHHPLVVTSLFSAAGLIPGSTGFAEPTPSTDITIDIRPITTARPIPPEPPPPRA